MSLVERDQFLETLTMRFDEVNAGNGHCIFITGEAGIGKTSLVNVFIQSLPKNCAVYKGTCDALFTPAPLAPVYELILQLQKDIPAEGMERAILFNSILQELKRQEGTSLIIFEDIHWADEATLDFISFLSRRIKQLPCLLLATYRDTEIHTRHPLRNVLGQLIHDTYTKMELPLLTQEAVEKMAAEKGRTGKDVYRIAGGNPFYVSEILAAYHEEIPDSIRDSILYAYNNCDERAKKVWDILAIIPTAFEVDYLDEIVPGYAEGVATCIHHKILIVENKLICFRHDLFRKSIESILSPLEKLNLHKIILSLFLPGFIKHNQVARIVHHAKHANDYELVARYAPVAAKQALNAGAHREAAKFFLTAIDYYQGADKDWLFDMYQAYAYECYLTNTIRDAIIYSGKALAIAREKEDLERSAACLRLLSRLWWRDGNREKAESFGQQAVDLMRDQPACEVKAMAFSNMSQLKMLAGETSECYAWGEQAIAMANALGNDEILAHALNNVGAAKMMTTEFREEGISLLEQSLEMALRNGYHEHAARAYTNLQYNYVKLKMYQLAKETLERGMSYCEEKDLRSWMDYMNAWNAMLNLELGNWTEARRITDYLLSIEDQPAVIKINALIVEGTIRMRTGDAGAFELLMEATTKAFETKELQRIVPGALALLEYEWLNNETVIEKKKLDEVIAMLTTAGNDAWRNELAFWLKKAGRKTVPVSITWDLYDTRAVANAAAKWKQLGCRFQQAMLLSCGTAEEKRQALAIMDELMAGPVCEKMKQEMKREGMKNIPRGLRKSTRSNTAFLTDRELDVLQLLKEDLQNKEIATRLYISAKTVDHHISSILFKLEVNSRTKAIAEAIRQQIIK